MHALIAPGAGLARDLPRQTIREVIADKIAALIASSVIQVGDELPSERALASSLSVSRETVRGAIQALAARGIVEIAHGTRTRVAKADVGELGRGLAGRLDANNYTLDEVHAARTLVEQQVVALAATRISEEVLAALARSIEAQSACLGDPVQFLLCDREFHGAIYRSCGNALLADLAVDLYNFHLESRRRIVSRAGRIRQSVADHVRILDALEARDVRAAVSAFARHERRIYQSTAALLSEAARLRETEFPAGAKPASEG